jgi:hypothetical protein
MQNEFTAIIEQDGDWFIGYCPESPVRTDRVEMWMSVGQT